MISDTVKDIIAPCLWGATVNLLDLEADKFLIIERVLEHGGDRQIEFVLANFKHEDIIMCGATELLSESQDCQLLVFIF